MKRKTGIILFLVMNTALYSPGLLRAQCTNCQGTTSIPGQASSAIGAYTKATGLAAFASGFEAIASGKQSTGIGNWIHADGVQAMIFGSNATSTGTGSMVIGRGYGVAAQDHLMNGIKNSLMIGFNSIYPTLFISQSTSRTGSGKVGIGNVTDPQAKLHILAEHGEHSGLYLEQTHFRSIDFHIGNREHGINCTEDNGMIFLSGKNYIFNDGPVGIGTLYPAFDLDIQGSLFTNKLTLFDKDLYRESIEGWILRSDNQGNACWADPSIFNDNDWILSGSNIYRLEGQVGIGTSSTFGYKLAVNGAIITEEVTVKVSEDWPDYVFDEAYDLIPIDMLSNYIKENSHLPEVPSAADLLKNGLELGKMEAILLRKIEELTLYIICQEEKLEELESRVDVFTHIDEIK